MSKREWKVGSRVQCIEWKNGESTIHTGTATNLVMESRPKHSYGYRATQELEYFVSQITVKWDDGEEETLKEYEVTPEDTELERQFRTQAALITKQINEKLSLASKYLDEAEAIAEEHGIPFTSGVSPLGQSYLTKSFPEKWAGVSQEVMREVTEAYSEYIDSYYGWVHSAIC